MFTRYAVSVPVPFVGCDVLYRGADGPAEGPWPAKVLKVRCSPTESDPGFAIVDLAVTTSDGMVYLRWVPFREGPESFDYPPPAPDRLRVLMDVDDRRPLPPHLARHARPLS